MIASGGRLFVKFSGPQRSALFDVERDPIRYGPRGEWVPFRPAADARAENLARHVLPARRSHAQMARRTEHVAELRNVHRRVNDRRQLRFEVRHFVALMPWTAHAVHRREERSAVGRMARADARRFEHGREDVDVPCDVRATEPGGNPRGIPYDQRNAHRGVVETHPVADVRAFVREILPVVGMDDQQRLIEKLPFAKVLDEPAEGPIGRFDVGVVFGHDARLLGNDADVPKQLLVRSEIMHPQQERTPPVAGRVDPTNRRVRDLSVGAVRIVLEFIDQELVLPVVRVGQLTIDVVLPDRERRSSDG